MNISDINMEGQQDPVTSFNFSGARPEDLDASEYTLVTIAVDTSGSVGSFIDELVKMLNAAVGACRKSPRAENLLVRVVAFNDDVREVHGFAPLSSLADYADADLPCGGMTALVDGALSGIGAMNAYGKKLVDLNYSVNGTLFVITDGCENRSRVGDPALIRHEIERAVKGETIRGVTTVLVGINTSEHRDSLEAFQKDAGIDALVEVADATPQRLAKLAGYVSKSISSSSQALAQSSGQGATASVATANLTI
jgi:hypothetical protein